MEISAKKTKLMTNNISGINTEIRINGQKLETVTSFKYLGTHTYTHLTCILSIRVFFNALFNAFSFYKDLINNGKLLQRIHPEYIKLHLNRSDLGRG